MAIIGNNLAKTWDWRWENLRRSTIFLIGHKQIEFIIKNYHKTDWVGALCNIMTNWISTLNVQMFFTKFIFISHLPSRIWIQKHVHSRWVPISFHLNIKSQTIYIFNVYYDLLITIFELDELESVARSLDTFIRVVERISSSQRYFLNLKFDKCTK